VSVEVQLRGVMACLTIVVLMLISTHSLERILVKQNRHFSKMGFFGPKKGERRH